MLNLIVGFLNDVIIVGGTAITTAMLATKVVELPSPAVWLVATIMGLVQAARRLDSKLSASPVEPSGPGVRTEAELMAQVKLREEAITSLTDSIRKALDRPPVTPLRVDPLPAEGPLPVPKIVKDSS